MVTGKNMTLCAAWKRAQTRFPWWYMTVFKHFNRELERFERQQHPERTGEEPISEKKL
jgi:hypothetical protein